MKVSSPLFKVNPHLVKGRAVGDLDGAGSEVESSLTNFSNVPLFSALVRCDFSPMHSVQHPVPFVASPGYDIGK